MAIKEYPDGDSFTLDMLEIARVAASLRSAMYYLREREGISTESGGYHFMAQALGYLNGCGIGMTLAEVIARADELVSMELAQEKADLETTRENMMDEFDAIKAEYGHMCREVEQEIADRVSLEVARLEEERKQAASKIRKGSTHRRQLKLDKASDTR